MHFLAEIDPDTLEIRQISKPFSLPVHQEFDSISDIQYVNGAVFKDSRLVMSYGAGDCHSYFLEIFCTYSAEYLMECTNTHLTESEHNRKNDKKLVVWEGPVSDTSSFSLIARELGLRLHTFLSNAGVDFRYHETKSIAQKMTQESNIEKQYFIRRFHEVLNADLTIRLQWPLDLSPVSNGKLIVYMPWEFYHIPETFVQKLNSRFILQIWVPSSYNLNGFVASGVNRSKILVVPHGYDHIFSPMTLISLTTPNSVFQNDLKQFTRKYAGHVKFFLNAGSLHRKGIDVAIRGFISAFSPSDKVSLIIHTSYGSLQFLDEGLIELQEYKIFLLEGHLAQHEMTSLMKAIDVFVSTSRCEGFGLPILEAISLNKVIIAVGSTGQRDFLQNINVFRIPSKSTICKNAPCLYVSFFIKSPKINSYCYNFMQGV